MTTQATRIARLSLRAATITLLSGTLWTSSVSAQASTVTRLGLVGGSRVENITGATLSLGAQTTVAGLQLTALGEGHFFHGRPDARFQETAITIVHPSAPLSEKEEIICQDPTTSQVFARGKCQVGKAQVAATADLAVPATLGSNRVAVGMGYRIGHISEPYALVSVSGPSTDGTGVWVARLTLSKKTVGLKVGFGIG